MSLTEQMKAMAIAQGYNYVDHPFVEVEPEDLKGIPVLAKPLRREDVTLTPEEARLYERFSVEQVRNFATNATPINVMDEVQKAVL